MSGVLFGERELRRIAELALGAAKGDQAEALVTTHSEGLTRFANAAIHQNVAWREAELRVRVVKGKRVALISTNRLDDEGVRRAAEGASDLASRVPENPEFGGLPAARPIPAAPSAYVERTAEATPLERARAAARICEAARGRGLGAAGFVSTTAAEVAVASTLGVWAYAPQTYARVEVVAIGDAGSSFAERAATDFVALDTDGAATEAITKAVAAQRPRDQAPGEYEVVLEPYAVGDIVTFLGGSLTGYAVEEGRSFVGGKLGQKVTGSVTLVEDPYDPLGIPRAFDFEGQPSERVTLLEDGVARAVVYDSQTAHRTQNPNTGHALPPNPFVPVAPMHTRLEAGTSSRDDLLRAVKRGVLVTRFHYTRWVHQLRTIVTGMTRDGTFLIEDGEIAYPVKNFRFTQSYHEALGGTLAIGNDLRLLRGFVTASRVPALRLASFKFTGATQY